MGLEPVRCSWTQWNTWFSFTSKFGFKNAKNQFLMKKKYFKCSLYQSSRFEKTTTTKNQSRTNGPINAHLTIAQVMLKYNHNNENQEALSKYLQLHSIK